LEFFDNSKIIQALEAKIEQIKRELAE